MSQAQPKRSRGSSKDLARLALRSVEKGDLDAALRTLEEAERRGKRLPSVRRRLARALSEQALSSSGGDSTERAGALREACALTPRDAGAWRNLGRLLHTLRDYAGALEAYKEAGRVGGDPEEIRRLSAVARLRMGGPGDQGESDALAVLSEGASGGETLSPPGGNGEGGGLSRALARIGVGDLEGARGEIGSLLEGRPSLGPAGERLARHYLGRLLLLEERPQEAVPYLRDAFKSERKEKSQVSRSRPHLIRALLGAALDGADPRDGASLVLEAEGLAAEDGVGPEVPAMIDVARRAFVRKMVRQDLLREALPLLEAARRREPASPHREKDLALALERLGEREKAIRRWEKAIRLAKKLFHRDRDDPMVQLFLVASLRHAARLDRQSGRTAEASRKLSFSLQLDPDRLPVRTELGEMLLGLGRYREAIRCLAPLEKAGKAGPQIWTQMGIAYDRLGQSDRAIAYWGRASEEHPLAKKLLLDRLHERFLLSFRAGDLEGARGEVERARAIDPEDRDTILHASCLAMASPGEPACVEPFLPPIPEGAGNGGGGRPARQFSPRPEAAVGIGPAVGSICCGDGTRCEAIRTLLLRLVEQEGEAGADPIRRALLAEGCRLVTQSLASALEPDDTDPEP